MNLCEDLGMAALVEVHDSQDVEKAVECDAEIIGINNRNLETFEIDLHTTMKLAPLVPDKRIIVSESGIRDKNDIQLLTRSGVHAVLVGTSIMKSDNLLDKAKELVFAGKIVNGKN